MTPQAFIIPARADPDAIERARPTGTSTGDRCCSELLASPFVVNVAAVNTVAESVAATVPPERAWWQNIIYGLLHAAAADELCDTWDRDDLADEMARQITAEAQRLTQETEEEVRVPNAAFAALARIRNQEPAP